MKETILNQLILLVVFLMFHSVLSVREESSSTNGGMEILHLETPSAKLHAQLERLERFNEVFPPGNDSHFVPYGDRAIIALQFPAFHETDSFNPQGASQNNYGQVESAGPWANSYGSGNDYGTPATKYGPQPEYGYGAPEKQPGLRKGKDFGVVISQNYIYRRNVRDYRGFSKIFENARSTQHVLLDLARGLGSSTGSSGSGGGISSNLLDLLDPKHLQSFNNGWKEEKSSSPQKSPPQSFALIAIETRVKISGPSGSGELSLTNGTLIFPSAKNPKMLAFLPFILQEEGDIANIFHGQEYSEGRAHLPEGEATTLFPFVKMVEGVHADAHRDGRKSLERNRKLVGGLMRERLPMPQELFQDTARLEEEQRAKRSPWLTTFTIGVRTISPVEVRKMEYGPALPLKFDISPSYGRELSQNYEEVQRPSTENLNNFVSKGSSEYGGGGEEVYFFKGSNPQ